MGIRDIQSQPDTTVANLQREVEDLRKQVILDLRSQPDKIVANLQREVEDLRNQVDRVFVDVKQVLEQRIQSDPAVRDLRRQVDDLIARYNSESDSIKRESWGGRDYLGVARAPSLEAEAARLQRQLEQQLTSTAAKLEMQLAAARAHGGGGSGGQVDQWLVRELGDKASIKQLNTLTSQIQLEFRDLHSNLAAELRELNSLLNKKLTHRQLEIALAKLRAEIVIPQGAS